MLIKRKSHNKNILGQLLGFLWERKAWWLVPTIIMMIIFGILIILAQNTALNPFVYALF